MLREESEKGGKKKRYKYSTWKRRASDTEESSATSDVESVEVKETFLNGNENWPIFKSEKTAVTYSDCLQVLADPQAKEKYPVCNTAPLRCRNSYVFLVDVSQLRNEKDLLADGNGKYKWGGRRYLNYDVHFKGSKMEARLLKSGKGNCVLNRTYYLAKTVTGSTFRRITTKLRLHNNELPLVILQYIFDSGKEEALEMEPHGNRKCDNKPHQRTMASAMETMRQKVSTGGRAKDIAHRMWTDNGGVIDIENTAAASRDRAQIYNLKRKVQAPLQQSTSDGDIVNVLHLFKQGNFIRDYKIAPFSVVAYTDQQIKDLVRFCTQQKNFSIFSIDSTFNIGKYDVTCTTYQNLLLQTKRKDVNGNHPSPVFIGPTLVHAYKDRKTYEYFFSTLRSEEKRLGNLLYYGTDGDDAIIRAAENIFTNGKGLRCFVHARRDIKRYIQECGMQSVQRELLKDVFGELEGNSQCTGLVDCIDDAEYDQKFAKLKGKWDNLESTCKSNTIPTFHNWINKYWSKVIKTSMLASLRRCAGIGGRPTSGYTTNHVESIHNQIKDVQKGAKKGMSVTDFLLHLQHEVNMQTSLVQQAVIGKGEYSFKKEYANLEVKEDVWYTFTKESKEKHMSKVFRATVKPLLNQNAQDDDNEVELVKSDGGEDESSLKKLSVSVEKSGLVSPPFDTLKGMWKKAEVLLNTNNYIGKAMGSFTHDPRARLIASESNPKEPHFIYAYDTGRVVCEKCPSYKDHKICKHSLAGAEEMSCLAEFLKWRKNQYKGSNLDRMVKTTFPVMCGRKANDKPSRNRRQKRLFSPAEEILDRLESTPQPSSSSPPCPWRAGSHPFVITKLSEVRSILCAGCKEKFSTKEGAPAYGVILRRNEKDFKKGSCDVTPTATPRAYHVDLGCVRRRHPDFGAQSRHSVTKSTKSQLSGEVIKYIQDVLGVVVDNDTT